MTDLTEIAQHPSSDCPCESCQRVWKLLGVTVEAGFAYVPLGGMGICKRCGFREDLRMGACFECADFVKGKNHGDGIHELWDRDRPNNRWIVTLATLKESA